MYFFLLRFEIPAHKINEFDLAFQKMVKWPVYSLYAVGEKTGHQTFELLRDWQSEAEMKQEVESPDFINMIGMVRVLGNVIQSRLYSVASEKNPLEAIQ
jgi:hypothetical protein